MSSIKCNWSSDLNLSGAKISWYLLRMSGSIAQYTPVFPVKIVAVYLKSIR